MYDHSVFGHNTITMFVRKASDISIFLLYI